MPHYSPRWALIAIVAFSVAALLLWKISGNSAQSERLYITAPVQRADLTDTVLATGTIKAMRKVSVGAQVSGQVKTLKVALGQVVKTGDLIAEIDPRTQQNALRNAEAALNSYQAQLRVKQAVLVKATLDFKRQQSMLADEATSRESFDNAKAALGVAEAEVAQQQAQIEQGKIVMETAQVNLGYTRIVAPIDGIVVAVPVEEGQTVNANQTTPTLVTLAQLDTVTIRAEISEGDVTRVKPGMPAYFTILGEPDHRYDATLKSIDPGPQSLSDSTTSSASGSTSSSGSSSSSSTSTAIYYYGLLDVPNTDNQLRIDMTTQVSIIVAEAKQVLVIPATALGDRNADGSFNVDVLEKDKQAATRQVKIGLNNNVSAQVLSGLNEGEAVILGQSAPGASLTKIRSRPPGL